MLVTDRYTATVIVERQWSGSVLAAHSSGDTIYAYRTLTVQRGQLGTTAATHNTATDVAVFTPPPLVRDLTIAEALVGLAREQSGYARTVGTGEANAATPRGRPRTSTTCAATCFAAHGRKARIGVNLMADIDVNVSGPFFDGRARAEINRICREAEDEVAAQLYSEVMGNLNRSIKHPTPYYETQIDNQRLSVGRRVHDRGIVYGVAGGVADDKPGSAATTPSAAPTSPCSPKRAPSSSASSPATPGPCR
jgi:hypothetical protein